MMNKSEKAQLANLQKELALALAMRFIDYDPVQMNIPTRGESLVVGWHFNQHTMRVVQGCTNGISHSRSSTTETNSQRAGGPWFATEAEALMALRSIKQREYANELANIDARISASRLAHQRDTE